MYFLIILLRFTRQTTRHDRKTQSDIFVHSCRRYLTQTCPRARFVGVGREQMKLVFKSRHSQISTHKKLKKNTVKCPGQWGSTVRGTIRVLVVEWKNGNLLAKLSRAADYFANVGKTITMKLKRIEFRIQWYHFHWCCSNISQAIAFFLKRLHLHRSLTCTCRNGGRGNTNLMETIA